jgi:hypothetical protein
MRGDLVNTLHLSLPEMKAGGKVKAAIAFRSGGLISEELGV